MDQAKAALRTPGGIGAALALVLLLNGALLGLTDDEAYYWVLAGHPALGYAYHPPMVAWVIAAARLLFGWFLRGTALVRLPAAVSMGAVFYLALSWVAGNGGRSLNRATLLLLSFAGFFALSWMIVPDTTLFLGWMLAFLGTWRVCSGSEGHRDFTLIALGVAIAMLSKYSGVFVAISSLAALALWAPRERRHAAIAHVVSGGIAAVIPILVWNSQHEWASILYQIRERHEGASLSFVRYLRFWAVELFAAGPLFVLGFVGLVRRGGDEAEDRVFRYCAVWAAPGLLFCIQPLFSDFKPHWAFVAWWPVALAFAWKWSRGLKSDARFHLLSKAQAIYGLTLGAIVLLSCHLPLLGPFVRDPRLDVTNDLYGWDELAEGIRGHLGQDGFKLPVIGSRYQTASQAAFALGKRAVVTLLPRDVKARDEWPMIDQADGFGPQWPRLLSEVLYVRDNRYDEEPKFVNASCLKIARMTRMRGPYPAKWVEVWSCRPER